MDVVSPLQFYNDVRIAGIALNAFTFVLASIQLVFDRKSIFTLEFRWQTHRAFRICAFVASALEIAGNVDYMGVFGIYSVPARVFFKVGILLPVSGAMTTYVYFSAKPCFPFIFRNSRKAQKRLRYFLTGFWFTGNVLYTLNIIFRDNTFGTFLMTSLVLILTSTALAANILFFRMRSLVVTSGTKSGTDAERLKEIRKSLNQWRNFTVVFSVVILLVAFLVGRGLVDIVQDFDIDRGTLEENLYIDPTEIGTVALQEVALIFLATAAIYLILWRAWVIKRPGTKSSNTNSKDLPASTPKALSSARSMSYEPTFTNSNEAAAASATTVAGIDKNRGRYSKWGMGSPSHHYRGAESPSSRWLEVSSAQPPQAQGSHGNSQLRAASSSYNYRLQSPSASIHEGSIQSQGRVSHISSPPSYHDYHQSSGLQSPSARLDEGSTHSQGRVPHINSPPSFHNSRQSSGFQSPSARLEEGPPQSQARVPHIGSAPRGSVHNYHRNSGLKSSSARLEGTSMSEVQGQPPPRFPPPRRPSPISR